MLVRDIERGNWMKELKETTQKGLISIENWPVGLLRTPGYMEGALGIQIATDGRIWVCINGVAFLRFKPNFKIIQA